MREALLLLVAITASLACGSPVAGGTPLRQSAGGAVEEGTGGTGGLGGHGGSIDPEDAPCAIGPAMRELAGAGATDCGHFEVTLYDPAPDALGDCYVDAFENQRPFHGWYAYWGYDSRVATGMASDGTDVWVLQHDSCPGGCGTGDPHLYRYECVGPRQFAEPEPGAWLDCESRGEREQLCP